MPEGHRMRTTVHLDDRLVKRAVAVTGARTKKEPVRRREVDDLIGLFGRPLLKESPRQFLKWRRRG